jgi:sugar phosphate isomerase/epimerase
VGTELILAATTLWQVPIEVRGQAARAAGFAAIGLHHVDPPRWRSAGRTDAEVAARLGDLGVHVQEVGFAHRWAGAGAAAEADELLSLAILLGARRVNAGLFEVQPAERVLAGFKALCQSAADRGLEVALEFFSFGGVATLAAACELIRASAAPNAGLLIDTWHVHRSGAAKAGLGAYPDVPLGCVQVADAAPAAGPDVGEESRHQRLLPGDGVIDLVGMLTELGARRPLPPVAVEVISDRLAAADPFAVARMAAATTTAVLASAGWPG